MKMTKAGLDLIKSFEGFRSTAYRDPIGVLTIGFGHTSMAGPPQVFAGQNISRAQAEEILARDVEQFASSVKAAVKVNLTDDQFSALVSFAYNVGSGNFRKSSVLRLVNAGDFDGVPARLNLWVKAGGKTLPGLVRRRAAEAEMFITPAPTIPTPTAPRFSFFAFLKRIFQWL